MASATNPLEGIQQDKDGNYFDVCDIGDGSGPQVYKGKTIAEVFAQYRKAQANATKKIREQSLRLRIENTPDPATPAPTFTPHTPTADELWRLAEDLKSPTTAGAAIRRAIAWELGADPATIRESIQRGETERRRVETHAAGAEFMAAHPEFKPCEENEQAIYGWLDARGLGYGRKNLEIAFDALKTGLVLRAPQQPATPTQPTPEAVIPPTASRPRGSSTGLSQRNSSAVPPTNGVAKPGRLTAAELWAMDTRELERKLNGDPVFKAEAERAWQAEEDAARAARK